MSLHNWGPSCHKMGYLINLLYAEKKRRKKKVMDLLTLNYSPVWYEQYLRARSAHQRQNGEFSPSCSSTLTLDKPHWLVTQCTWTSCSCRHTCHLWSATSTTASLMSVQWRNCAGLCELPYTASCVSPCFFTEYQLRREKKPRPFERRLVS